MVVRTWRQAKLSKLYFASSFIFLGSLKNFGRGMVLFAGDAELLADILKFDVPLDLPLLLLILLESLAVLRGTAAFSSEALGLTPIILLQRAVIEDSLFCSPATLVVVYRFIVWRLSSVTLRESK